MSVAISISRHPEEVWMIKNSVFRWYASLLETRFPDDEDICEELEAATCFGGVSLDTLWNENPQLALRFRDALQTVAAEIADGTHASVDDSEESDHNLPSKRTERFRELVVLLDRFEPSTAKN